MRMRWKVRCERCHARTRMRIELSTECCRCGAEYGRVTVTVPEHRVEAVMQELEELFQTNHLQTEEHPDVIWRGAP